MKKVKKIIIVICLTLGVVASAATSGFFLGNLIAFKMRRQPNYNLDVKAYTETIKDIDYISTDTPNSRCASDAFIIATHKLDERNYYSIDGGGLVETGLGRLGNLHLWGSSKKENDVITTNIVAWNKVISNYQVGIGYDYDTKTGDIDYCTGKSHSDGSVTWEEEKLISVKDYEDEWGWHPSTFFTYIISSKTALDNHLPTIDTSTGEKLYSYSLKLNTITAVSNYAKQLKKMSRLDNYPVFSYIKINFIVDENFEFRSVTINEKYTVFMYGVFVNCNANIYYNFDYSK